MNKTPLAPSRSDLVSRFRAYRRAQLGAFALLSMSTVRAISAVEERDAARLTRSIVAAGKTDDAISEVEIADRDEAAARLTRSPLLSGSERAALVAVRPSSRSVIWRKPAAVETDEPLDPGFIPAPVERYESAFLPMSPELAAIEAQAQSEAAAEVAESERINARDAAAVAFRSDYDAAAPVDYAPSAPAVVRAAPVAPVTVAPSPATLAPTGNPINDHAALLAAVLGKSSPRRITFRA